MFSLHLPSFALSLCLFAGRFRIPGRYCSCISVTTFFRLLNNMRFDHQHLGQHILQFGQLDLGLWTDRQAPGILIASGSLSFAPIVAKAAALRRTLLVSIGRTANQLWLYQLKVVKAALMLFDVLAHYIHFCWHSSSGLCLHLFYQNNFLQGVGKAIDHCDYSGSPRLVYGSLLTVQRSRSKTSQDTGCRYLTIVQTDIARHRIESDRSMNHSCMPVMIVDYCLV